MTEFAIYVLQLSVAMGLMAMALSVYLDGFGYVVLHIVALAGVGAYVFTVTTSSEHAWPVSAGLFAGVAVAAVAGILSAEAIGSLRGDGLTLATFGIGVSAVEAFRFSSLTGSVFGISGVPGLLGECGPVLEGVSAMV